jgi:hypothetical protein
MQIYVNLLSAILLTDAVVLARIVGYDTVNRRLDQTSPISLAAVLGRLLISVGMKCSILGYYSVRSLSSSLTNMADSALSRLRLQPAHSCCCWYFDHHRFFTSQTKTPSRAACQ